MLPTPPPKQLPEYIAHAEVPMLIWLAKNDYEKTAQEDSLVHKSPRKFAKPELAYGLAMGGPTDSKVGSRVHASRKSKFHDYTVDLQSPCVDFRKVINVY